MFTKFERTIACRYLRSPRQEGFVSVIAWLTFLGIALGVAALIIVMSVMNGFRAEILKNIIGLNGHISVAAYSGNLPNFDALVEKVRPISGIDQVIPHIERQAMLMVRGQARGVSVRGMRAEDLKARDIVAAKIKAGTLDDYGRIDPETNEVSETVAIGRRLADRLALNVGDRISLISPDGNTTAFGTLPRQKGFRIAAIFEVGMYQYDESIVFMPLEQAQSFFKMPGTVSNLEIFIKNPDEVAEIDFMLGAALGDDVRIFDWQNANNAMFQTVQVERNVMFLILTLIILIAAFNIISSLIMLVKDKTRDIAIMRTMGATKYSIMRIFFMTGATIGLTGTFLGVSLGLGVAYNIEGIRQWIQSLLGTDLFRAEFYFLAQLPSKVELSDVTFAASIAIGLSFLATLYPSWRAARLDPVEALRQ